MVLEYPATELYILLAISVTFLGGVVLSEGINSSWIQMLFSYLFVVVSWGNIAAILGEQFLAMELILSEISLETGLHCLALLLFLVSSFAVLPATRTRTEPVFVEGDGAE